MDSSLPASSAIASPPALRLESPIELAHGVGPRRAWQLRDLGVGTCADLLEYFPRDYVEFHGQRTISQIHPMENAAVEGDILQTRSFPRRPRRFEALLDDGSGRCQLVWFNRWNMQEKIQPGTRLRATGKMQLYNGRYQMVQPQYQLIGPAAPQPPTAALEPVYPANQELSSAVIARIIHANLEALLGQVGEWFSPAQLHQRALLTRREAFSVIHRPPSLAQAYQARRSLAYHEFFIQQTAIAVRRHHHRTQQAAAALRVDQTVEARIRALLHFPLTNAQNRVLADIQRDLAQTRPMNRLLQGDVGSGKTVLALFAMLFAVASGGQAAFMAPTEILAEQHFDTLHRYLSASRVQMALLTGGQPPAVRESTIRGIADGSIGITVATHALLSDVVQFKNLRVLVVDEQHKFGVRQRALIRSRHPGVHTLVMTATPIPRTLAMTIFGDLDSSVIDEMPPGRQPIGTRMVPENQRQKAYQFVADQLKAGRQAYIVLPAVDENVRELANAVQCRDELAAGVLKDFRIGLVHGRMAREQRQQVMESFRQHQLDVLVATTVIEVGVDVPNACVMVIEHAQQFGLSQLHQLRGRVGRGTAASWCLLLAQEPTDTAKARMAALCKYPGGFDIAEEDLKIRGMGEIVGTRQSGRADLQFAELLFDAKLLAMARADALALVANDPHLIRSEHAMIRQIITRDLGDAVALANVG
jgi:ATP-dependent DNA helicase RecG